MSAKTRALYAVHCQAQGQPAPERWTPEQLRRHSTMPPPAGLSADLDAKADRLERMASQLLTEAAALRAAAARTRTE